MGINSGSDDTMVPPIEMRGQRIFRLSVSLGLLTACGVVGWWVLAGGIPEAVAQAIPEPELVVPGEISLEDRNETFPMEDPATGSLWFSVYEDDFDAQTIFLAPRKGHGWGRPVVAPFSGRWGDRAPRFSPDGARLYFTSGRPLKPGAEPGDMNIWVVKRGAGGGWSEAELVPPPVSMEGVPDIHASITADGTVFVASRRPDTHGASDIYRVAPGSERAENLGAPVNDEHSQPDLLVSSDESWMVLVITDFPGGLGGDDLYLVERLGRGWRAPKNLGAPINSSEYEYGPTLSRDGRFLYFTSHRRGSADVFRVPVSTLRSAAGG